MKSPYILGNHIPFEVNDDELEVTINNNEVHFCYHGMHNRTIDDRFELFRTPFNFEAQAQLLGDGFQMLAQTTGTRDQVIDIGRCPDNNPQYRLLM
ncbi:hypothetical protein [Vibrio vulnificus]|uniref:hypothetical protein n=1 Tax=Vibrio vulnificus TaxID=672 RepID=UPI001F5CC04E|nr:hypothetical protein [Vibrio vulnificus]